MKTERSKLIKKLDTLCSEYVRRSGSKNWIAECYTCWKKDNRKNLQNAHFISRACLWLRRSLENCRVWCYRCNVMLSWNYIEYTRRMIDEIWIDKVDELRSEKHKIHKVGVVELREKIEYFTNLLKEWDTEKQ